MKKTPESAPLPRVEGLEKSSFVPGSRDGCVDDRSRHHSPPCSCRGRILGRSSSRQSTSNPCGPSGSSAPAPTDTPPGSEPSRSFACPLSSTGSAPAGTTSPSPSSPPAPLTPRSKLHLPRRPLDLGEVEENELDAASRATRRSPARHRDPTGRPPSPQRHPHPLRPCRLALGRRPTDARRPAHPRGPELAGGLPPRHRAAFRRPPGPLVEDGAADPPRSTGGTWPRSPPTSPRGSAGGPFQPPTCRGAPSQTRRPARQHREAAGCHRPPPSRRERRAPRGAVRIREPTGALIRRIKVEELFFTEITEITEITDTSFAPPERYRAPGKAGAPDPTPFVSTVNSPLQRFS